MKKATTIGGQALIEGIMMKGPESTALAVRKPDKTIHLEYINENRLAKKHKIFSLPVIRGVVTFIESMITGYNCLMKSAEISGMADLENQDGKDGNNSGGTNAQHAAKSSDTEQEAAQGLKDETKAYTNDINGISDSSLNKEAEEKNKAEGNEAYKNFDLNDSANSNLNNDLNSADKKIKKNDDGKLSSFLMIISTVLGVAIAIFLFTYIPALLFDLLNLVAAGKISAAVRPLFEGVLKIAIFVGYIALVSLMPDIKRVFMYHGAEHKTIFCYENGLELSVENVKIQRRFHPRCGTSFMILMLIISILVGFVVVTCFPGVTKYRILWVFIKILLVPIICGLGYELIKICGRYDNLFTKIVSRPGMWLQRITTKEPQDDMIEVAIEALKAVIPDDPEKDRW